MELLKISDFGKNRSSNPLANQKQHPHQHQHDLGPAGPREVGPPLIVKPPNSLFSHLRLNLRSDATLTVNPPPSRSNSAVCSPSPTFVFSIQNPKSGAFDDLDDFSKSPNLLNLFSSNNSKQEESRSRFGSSYEGFVPILHPIEVLEEDDPELAVSFPNEIGKVGINDRYYSSPYLNDKLNVSESQNTSSAIYNLQFQSEKVRSLPFLFNLLVKIFLMDVKISELDLNLSPLEKYLLFQLLKRKFKKLGKTVDKKSLDCPDRLWELIDLVKSEKSAKRIEERKKFVFKHTMKKLKEQFTSQRGGMGRNDSPQCKESFYEHYFGWMAEEKGLELRDFYDPLNPKNGNSCHKTLSNIYLALLFESSAFQDDFSVYLSSMDFYIDYQKSTIKKIEKLLLKWVKLLEKEGAGVVGREEGSEALHRLIDAYFEGNKQCKLPWTPKEISHAISSFQKHLIEKIGKK